VLNLLGLSDSILLVEPGSIALYIMASLRDSEEYIALVNDAVRT
jgi:hypothetical protein